MMRYSETMRAAPRLLLSHPIVCLLAAFAAVVMVVGVLGPIKVVHAEDVAPEIQVESNAWTRPAGTTVVTGSGYHGGAALKFSQNGTASTTVNPGCSAVCDVTLWAQGGQSGGQASLSVNGSPPQALKFNTRQPYTFLDANLPAGPGAQLRVTVSGTGTGHNAILDYVTFPRSSSGTPPPTTQCSDNQDNDGDGAVDLVDPGCTEASDNDETNAPPPTTQCSDNQDNDGDGAVDLIDPGCTDATDNDETNATGTTARLVGAGDIATNGSADTATAELIQTVLDTRPDARVFTAGDNAYPNGAASDFTNKYQPAWGPFKNRTSPSPGNHDYVTSGASGYKNYFGSLATPNGSTYYAYDLGEWRIYSLDSNISMAMGSPQYNFVQTDLESDKSTCELAYWHHPIASSGEHGNIARARPIFALFDTWGGDLVLNGHDHNYERFTKIDSLGRPSEMGVRQIIVGTGGTSLRGLGFVQPGSEVRNSTTHGIVDINLTSTGYTGTFVPAPGFGSFTDRPDLGFQGTCGTN